MAKNLNKFQSANIYGCDVIINKFIPVHTFEIQQILISKHPI